MTKKEFLSFSLPYKLPVISKHGNSIGHLTAVSEDTDFIFRTVCVGGREKEMKHIDNTLPVIRPLSDLTKEIDHKGESFVPISKVSVNSRRLLTNIDSVYPNLKNGIDLLCFRNSIKLIEWRFDIANLIDKSEAVDYHTLEGFSF